MKTVLLLAALNCTLCLMVLPQDIGIVVNQVAPGEKIQVETQQDNVILI